MSIAKATDRGASFTQEFEGTFTEPVQVVHHTASGVTSLMQDFLKALFNEHARVRGPRGTGASGSAMQDAGGRAGQTVFLAICSCGQIPGVISPRNPKVYLYRAAVNASLTRLITAESHPR